MVQDIILKEASQQLVKDMTRSELVAGVLQSSCRDHCYYNVREKISGPFVEAVGGSDNLEVSIVKEPVSKQQVINTRV